jgi:hypothetical protein
MYDGGARRRVVRLHPIDGGEYIIGRDPDAVVAEIRP